MRKGKKRAVSGAYVLGVLAATQTALDMAGETEEGQEGTLRVRLDAERADEINAGLPKACRTVASNGKFVIEDDSDDGRDGQLRYWQTVVDFWDEENDRPLIDSLDFKRALLQVGEQMLEYAIKYPEDVPQNASHVVKAVRLLLDGDIWSSDAKAWAEVGLGHDEWVVYLEDWDNSIGRLRKEVAWRKVREAQMKHREVRRQAHRELRRRLAIEAENIPF